MLLKLLRVLVKMWCACTGSMNFVQGCCLSWQQQAAGIGRVDTCYGACDVTRGAWCSCMLAISEQLFKPCTQALYPGYTPQAGSDDQS